MDELPFGDGFPCSKGRERVGRTSLEDEGRGCYVQGVLRSGSLQVPGLRSHVHAQAPQQLFGFRGPVLRRGGAEPRGIGDDACRFC